MSWQSLLTGAARFPRLFLGMCIMIGALIAMEVLCLQWIGAKYEPAWSIRSAKVVEFSVSADGRWGASRVVITRSGQSRKPLEYVILVHDLQNLNHTVQMNLGNHDFHRIAISPGGNYFAFASWNGLIGLSSHRLLNDGIRTIDHLPRGRIELCWSPNSKYIAATNKSSICVWSMPSGDLLHKFDHGCESIPMVSFSSDSQMVLGGCDDKLRYWSAPDGTLLKTVPMPTGATLASLAFDAGFAVFAIGRELFVWNFKEGREVWRQTRSLSIPTQIVFSPNNSLAASIQSQPVESGERSDRLLLRCTKTGRLIATVAPNVGHIADITFSSAGTLCLRNGHGEIIGWDIPSNRKIWQFSYLQWDAVQSAAKSLLLNVPFNLPGQRHAGGHAVRQWRT